jgi:hypothetical protein
MLLAAGCNKKNTPFKTITTEKDSTGVEIYYKDTIVKTPAKVVRIHDTVPCPEADYSAQKKDSTGKLTAKVTLKKGVLNVECNVDSLQQRITWLEKNQFTLKTKNTVKEIPVQVEVPKWYVPNWLKWLLAISLLLNAWFFRYDIIGLIKKLLPNG